MTIPATISTSKCDSCAFKIAHNASRQDFDQLTLKTRVAQSTNAHRLRQYTPCRRLRKTLYGETTLCHERIDPTKDIVLKRLNLHALFENKVGGFEDPRREQQVIDMLAETGGHRHIVSYKHDAMFTCDGNVYITMSFCNEGDLYDHMEAQPNGKLCERQALKYVQQIALGVQFLHGHGIAHRDLSLENILLHDGQVRICDFGLSIDTNSSACDSVGKFYYMAPEVVKGTEYAPKAADIWSLGIILFILLTGSPLIADEELRETTYYILSGYGVEHILKMWGMEKEVGTTTTELLSQMLMLNPSDRLSIDEVVNHACFSIP